MLNEYYNKIKNNFDKECTTPTTVKLLQYAGEYFEGDIDSSKDKYNKLLRKSKIKDWIYTIYHSPWADHSIKLFEMVREVIPLEAFPDVVVNKIEEDRKHLKKLEKYSHLI
jgi:hypothetical protein